MPTSSKADQFWNARSSWYGSHLEAQDKAASLRSNVDLRRKEAIWRRRGEQYLRNTGLSSEFVRVDPRLHQDLLEQLRSWSPIVTAVMEDELGELALDAFEKWPVESGLSKSLLDLSFVVVNEDSFKGQIESKAPYTTFIRISNRTDAEKAKRREKSRAIAAELAKQGRTHEEAITSATGRRAPRKGSGPQPHRLYLDDPSSAVGDRMGRRILWRMARAR